MLSLSVEENFGASLDKLPFDLALFTPKTTESVRISISRQLGSKNTRYVQMKLLDTTCFCMIMCCHVSYFPCFVCYLELDFVGKLSGVISAGNGGCVLACLYLCNLKPFLIKSQDGEIQTYGCNLHWSLKYMQYKFFRTIKFNGIVFEFH